MLKNVNLTDTKKLQSLEIASQEGNEAKKVIFNLSNRILTKVEEDVFKMGLQFGLPVSKPKFIDHF